MNPYAIGVVGLGAVGVLSFSGSADASVPTSPPVGADDSSVLDVGTGWDGGSPIDYSSTDTPDMSDANMQAFLATVRQAESAGQYNALVGGGTFSDMSKFPQWAGWHNSHAAGAYQFEPATWTWVAGNTGCHDMSNGSQDTNAAWLANFYAKGEIASGDMAGACAKLASQWESIKVKGATWYVATWESFGGVMA